MIAIPEELIIPDYQSNTIANIPGTVASLLSVPFDGLPPLRSSLWRPVSGDVQRVVVIILDALGQNVFSRTEEMIPTLIDRAAVRGKITSVFPSTTVAALSSIWTGFAPARHGLVGLRLFFPEFGVLGQMLGFSPNFASFPESLTSAGADPESFLDVPGFAEQLANEGVETHALKNRHLFSSALSRMHDRGVAGRHGFLSLADMFIQTRKLLEEHPGKILYVNAYWPAIDTLSHAYGPYHPAVTAEIKIAASLFQEIILDGLSPQARKGTVVVITADHGQVLTPSYQQISVDDHPLLKKLLLMRPNGEPRTPYLFARQGKQQEMLEYLQSELKQEMIAWRARDVLDSGLLGPPPHSPKVVERVGDVIAAMRQGYLLLTREEKEKAWMMARHGGLSADEMEVPWLAYRLDG